MQVWPGIGAQRGMRRAPVGMHAQLVPVRNSKTLRTLPQKLTHVAQVKWSTAQMLTVPRWGFAFLHEQQVRTTTLAADAGAVTLWMTGPLHTATPAASAPRLITSRLDRPPFAPTPVSATAPPLFHAVAERHGTWSLWGRVRQGCEKSLRRVLKIPELRASSSGSVSTKPLVV